MVYIEKGEIRTQRDRGECYVNTKAEIWVRGLQAHLGATVGSVPDHHNKASTTIKCAVIFPHGESFLQFIRNTASVELTKVKHSETGNAHTSQDTPKIANKTSEARREAWNIRLPSAFRGSLALPTP